MEKPAKGTIFAPFETWKSYKPVFLSFIGVNQRDTERAAATRTYRSIRGSGHASRTREPTTSPRGRRA